MLDITSESTRIFKSRASLAFEKRSFKRSVREMMEIRQLRTHEWELLRQVRLAAVTDSPHAFAESAQETEQMPQSLWEGRTQRGAEGRTSFCSIALADGHPQGIAVGLIDSSDPSRTYLVSMWVSPHHRGTDVATSLLHEVIAWASARGAELLFAGVKPGNDRAAAFYQKNGFNMHQGMKPEHPATSDCDQVLKRELK